MVAVHGLDAKQGETAFAFMVLRLVAPVDRDGLIAVIQRVAPMIPDVEALIGELPDDLEDAMRFVGVPWSPPEAGHAVDAQRRLIEAAASSGVEAAWFFQTGTSLPTPTTTDDDDDDAESDDDDDAAETDDDDAIAQRVPGRGRARAETTVDWGQGEVTGTELSHVDDDDDDGVAGSEAPRQGNASRQVSGEIGAPASVSVVSDDDDDDDDDGDADWDDGDDDEDDDEDDAGDDDLLDDLVDASAGEDDDTPSWSHGLPPQLSAVPFPVDGYPAIIADHDYEDFGLALKLAGPWIPGEGAVLLGFHALWLAPYGGRYRNAEVTIDRTHHSAHLWVDRFLVPSSAAEQVHHVLWIASKLHEVMPIVHARFGGATMAQKYGGLMGDTSEPFVLGGNPLLKVYSEGGEAAVDAWIAGQGDWSKEELAQMLRELAVEIVSHRDADDEGGSGHAHGAPPVTGDEVDALFGELTSEPDDDEDEDEDEDEDDDEEADLGRYITSYTGEVLALRAAAGTLDPRTAVKLRPVLEIHAKYEHRRAAVVEVLGALRDRASVPAMIRALEDNPIKGALDAVAKEGFLTSTARALGAIGDPSAIPALSQVVAAKGYHNDKPRPFAANALARCLAAAPEPRDVDDAVLEGLLETIRDRNDGPINAESHLAFGRIAQQLDPPRRAVAARKLADVSSNRDDDTPVLARRAALVLASGTAADIATTAELRHRLHAALTTPSWDHDATVRDLAVALQVAELVPDVVEPSDLVWLTRFAEAEVRTRAHGMLELLGQPMPAAARFDRHNAGRLDSRDLLELLAEPHVIGKATLIDEAARRGLVAAHPAIIQLADQTIARATTRDRDLLDSDTRILESSVRALRDHLSDATISLFDRMLRHPNHHVKWELLQEPPSDPRLLGGMFHVLGENWGWQESTAREWLAGFEGSEAYEAARARATTEDANDNDDDGDDDAGEDDEVDAAGGEGGDGGEGGEGGEGGDDDEDMN